MAHTIIGEKIILYCKRKNMSQKELSQKTGIAEAVISRYVRGAVKPRIENLKKIAEAFGIKLCDLTGDIKDAMNITAYDETISTVSRNAALLTLEQKLEIINALLSDL